MQFNVADLLKEGYGAAREHEIDDDVRIDGEAHHLRGRVRFDRTRDGVLVRADMQTDAAGECSRCLGQIRFPVDVRFEEEYIPTVDVHTGARVDPPEGEEDAYRIDERHLIDLRVPVQQYWSMSLPMAPLCRQDCPGLCPHCGEPLGGAHRCEPEPQDERWAKLRDLKLR
jgi:uncharacterized protein